MEEPEKAGAEQPVSSRDPQSDADPQEAAGGNGAATRRRNLDDVTHAYERARDELNDAVRSLRAEVAKIDLEQARTRAKGWVDENPMLAVFIGVGAGILTGRVLSNAMRPEPPALSDRARHRAEALRGKAGDYADELGAALAYQLSRAARSAGEASEYAAHRGAEAADVVSKRARDVGKDLSGRAREAGRDVSRRAVHISEDASKRTEELADSLADSTARSIRILEDATDELADTLKKRSKKTRKKAKKNVDRGVEFSDSVLNVARTAVAAVVVKKVGDWMKALR